MRAHMFLIKWSTCGSVEERAVEVCAVAPAASLIGCSPSDGRLRPLSAPVGYALG